MATIITAAEVVKYGFVHPDYPVAYVCDHIQRKEQALFRKCYLGTSFYGLLLADLSDYSETPLYSAEATYQIDDSVCYDGNVFISTCADNQVNPGDDPGGCWVVAPKFESQCYQNLWETNLRYWLAYEICLTSLDYSTYAIGGEGATKQVSDSTGRVTVNEGEFKQVKRKARTDADEHLENMLAWMVEQTNSGEDGGCDFTVVPEVNKSCSTIDCIPFAKRKRRRLYFKE
jgi:hypothetical protein